MFKCIILKFIIMKKQILDLGKALSKPEQKLINGGFSTTCDDEFIRKLKIHSYPTFILINEENEIIYRGSALESLKEIEYMISIDVTN